MASFFDPGHGFLSSVDEVAIAVAAVLVFLAVGAASEYLWDTKGGAVVGALVGFLVALLWAPAAFTNEWHYAVVVAVPVLVLVYRYRGRGE